MTKSTTTPFRKGDIFRVPLANQADFFADIGADDYDHLIRLGVSPFWFYNSNGRGSSYVRAHYRGKLVTVARVLFGEPVGQFVRYNDGNRLNLTRDNLTLETTSRKLGRKGLK